VLDALSSRVLDASSSRVGQDFLLPRHSLPVFSKKAAMLDAMQCRRAIINYQDGEPLSYCLILLGTEERPGRTLGAVERETTFKEAYELFPAVRKHWKADGTAKE
jgi:hypothetical protein